MYWVSNKYQSQLSTSAGDNRATKLISAGALTQATTTLYNVEYLYKYIKNDHVNRTFDCQV